MRTKTAPLPTEVEFERCRWDPVRFAWVFLGIRLHPGQKRMVDAYMRRTESGWRALWLWIIVSAGNRAGKTLALAIIILHSCVYRIGLRPPKDPTDIDQVEHWGRIPYHWWHFAVEQAPAEQVFREIVTIMGGVHAAQTTGCPWAKQVGGAEKIVTATETPGVPFTSGSPKERGEYAWIKLAEELGGAEIHFRSTKAKALSSIGQEMNGVSMDEAGLEANLDTLIREVLHARRLGTGGQFILISTPSIATTVAFQDLWYTGDRDDPAYEDRRFSMRMSSRDNIGYGLDRESFDALVHGMDENWIKQNIDGVFIQAESAWFHEQSVKAAFREGLPGNAKPRAGAVYIHSLDPGLKDKCWSLVFRVVPDAILGKKAIGVSIDKQQGKQTTPGIVALGARQHKRYAMFTGKFDREGFPINEAWCETGVDNTALGGHMFRELLESQIGMSPKGIEFGGVTKTKRELLSDLRSAIDEGRIVFPDTEEWAPVRKQFLNYKLADRKIEQDLVTGMAIIVKLLRQAPVRSDEPPVVFDITQSWDEAHAAKETHDPNNINPRSIRRAMAARREARRQARLAETAGGGVDSE